MPLIGRAGHCREVSIYRLQLRPFHLLSRLAVRSMKRRSSFWSVFSNKGVFTTKGGGHVIFLFSVYDLERTKAVIFSVSLETDI